MELYCLKCKTYTRNINPQGLNVQYVIVKNLNLLKNKKQVDY